MTLHLVDGRFAQLRVVPETVALDYANDISALAKGVSTLVARAHTSLTDHRILKVSDALIDIYGTAREIDGKARNLAGAVGQAPVISPDQLDMALCPDGREGAPHGRAA